MSEINAKIRDTLLYIKANPGCDTNSEALDGFLVKDLEAQGLIEGIHATTISASSPQFLNIRMNTHGEQYLHSLQNPKKEVPVWHTNPFISGGIGLAVGLAVAFIVWYAKWQ